ncbi:MAG: polymerase, sigma-24 subunit, subfamily [Ramlibacter sp.]|nr:polymerase, sigma-24 subunit, subfamily [Ramlibacter sp.]
MKPVRGSPGEASLPADDGLAEAVRSQQAGAWEAIMRRHNRRLYRVARSMLRDDAEAEDALQEAYLSAFRAMADFRAEASLVTWLNRIVVNECMTRLRRQARRDNIVAIVALSPDFSQEDEPVPEQSASGEQEAPDDAVARGQVRALLERKIDELPQAFRAVFVMRALEEMSVEEVAELLRIPEATVRSRFFRARAQLREALAREVDFAMEDAFAFDGERCDRIVSGVLQALATPPPTHQGDATWTRE